MSTQKIFFRFCLTALFFSSLPCLLFAENGVILHDEFNELNKDNWELMTNPDKVIVKDGVLSLNISNGDFRITAYDLVKYGTLEAKVRYTQPFGEKRYYYIGLMDRKAWSQGQPGNGFVALNVFGNTLVFQAGRGKEFPGKILQLPLIKPVVNQWYVYKIRWQPNRLEVFIDEESLGYTDDPTYIPQAYLLPFIDAVSEGDAGPVGFEIDYIKITSP